MSPEVRALLWKEIRQLTRSRRAMLSATLMPLLFMVVMPIGQLFSFQAAGVEGAAGTRGLPPGTRLPAGISEMTTDPMSMFTLFLLPLFVTLSGVVVPSVAATYTVVVERERRSLELIMALPVRVRDILAAKLLAMLLLACAVVLPLFAVDAALLLTLHVADVAYVLNLLLVLLAALVFSIGVALLLALLARDFRTANNLNGAFVGPLVVLTTGLLFLVPSPFKLPALVGLLLLFGAATILAGLRWLTFERYLA